MKNNMNRVCAYILKWLSITRDLVWGETITRDCSATPRGKNKKYGRKLPTEPIQRSKQTNSSSDGCECKRQTTSRFYIKTENQPDMENNMNRVCAYILKSLSITRDLVWREIIIRDRSVTPRGKNKKYGRKLPTELIQRSKQTNASSGGCECKRQTTSRFYIKTENCLSEVQTQGTARNNFSAWRREDVHPHCTL
jgi:hypothetical protein